MDIVTTLGADRSPHCPPGGGRNRGPSPDTLIPGSGRMDFGSQSSLPKASCATTLSPWPTPGLFSGPHPAAGLRSFSLNLSLIFCSNPAVPVRKWECPCSRAEPGQPHWAGTGQAWAGGKEEPWNSSWSQLLQRRMLQEPGPWRHREDMGGFAPHHPNQFLTLEEKHHQLEQPPLLPGSQAPPEHMEPAGREHEERVVGLRHRRRGGCHSCCHPHTSHRASGASEVARRRRLGFTPNVAVLPGMLQRFPILWTSVLVMDREHAGWGPELSPLTGHHSSTRCALTCSHVGQSPTRLLEAAASCWDAPHENSGHPSGHCTEETPATAQGQPLQQLLLFPPSTPNLHSSPPLNSAQLRACLCTLREVACAHPHVCTHTGTHGKNTWEHTRTHNRTCQTTTRARGKYCTQTAQPPLTAGISKTGTG